MLDKFAIRRRYSKHVSFVKSQKDLTVTQKLFCYRENSPLFENTSVKYCYQTNEYHHTCSSSTNCRVVSAPRQRFQANCTVGEDILCLGR